MSKIKNIFIFKNYRTILNISNKLGIKNIDNEIIEYINLELLEKLNIILSEANKFKRITKRKNLNIEDLNNSLSIHNFKQINSFNNNYITDPLKEINLIEIVNSSLLDIPLNPLIIYNWFCINGEIPFLSTNYLKNNTIKINHCENEKEPILQRNNKIIMKYTKNISKELLNFIEILEENFQKEIRENLLNSLNYKNNLSKESEILLTIIETEPSLVQIFPYLLYFLFNELNNEKNYGIQNVQISVLYYLNAILNNKYFDFLPYLKDIIDCIVKLILFDSNKIIYNNNYEIFSIINIKNYSLFLLL